MAIFWQRKQEKTTKSQKIYAALFAAMWPYAPIQALYTVAWLSIWLFVWDDETDSAESLTSYTTLNEQVTSGVRRFDLLERVFDCMRVHIYIVAGMRMTQTSP
jgi:hypothetical protein